MSAMTRIIAITNQKGGVGKTTTGVNLAASLAATHRRVLLVDLDPQGNATMGSGDRQARAVGDRVSRAARRKTASPTCACARPTLAMMCCHRTANWPAPKSNWSISITAKRGSKHALQAVAADYDFILIDCPPALNLLTLNGLTAAQAVMIPMQCEYYALEGLSDLVGTIKRVRAHLNPDSKIEGLLRTMYDPRNTLAQQVSAQLLQHFGDKVYRTVIPRNVRLAEAPSHGLPALEFDRASKGAQAYLALAGEMLNRAAKKQRKQLIIKDFLWSNSKV